MILYGVAHCSQLEVKCAVLSSLIQGESCVAVGYRHVEQVDGQ